MKALSVPSKSPISALPNRAKRRLLFIGGAALAAFGLLFFLTDNPQSAIPAKTKTSNEAKVVLLAPRDADTRTLKDYSSLLGHNLFKPLVTTQVQRRTNTMVRLPDGSLMPAPIDGMEIQAAPQSAESQALSKWSYIGTVSVDGLAFALVQTDTGDYGYYRSGEALAGGVLKSVYPDRLIVVASNGEAIPMPKTSGAPPAPAPGASRRGGNNSNNPNNGNNAQAANNAQAPAQDVNGSINDNQNNANNANQNNNNGRGNRRNRGNRGGNGGFPGGGFPNGGPPPGGFPGGGFPG